jgi:hypothetical protein
MRARHLLIASALAVSVPVVLAGSASAGRPDVARPAPAEYPITVTECGFDIELTGVKAVVGRFTTTLGFLDVDPGTFRFLDLDTSAARVVDVCASLG